MTDTIFLEDKQNKLLKMLWVMDQICRDNNLIYSLAYGSVLGAMRHKGFIPWDPDIDIIVPINMYQRFCEAMENELPHPYKIYSKERDPSYEELFVRIGLRDKTHHELHIDVFPITGAPNSRLGRKIFSKIAYLTHRCYFVKKVNVNNNYKNRPRKRRMAITAKFLLSLIPSKFFILLFKKLSTLYSFQNSEMVYSLCGTYGLGEFINRSSLGQPAQGEFEGFLFPIPREWDEYLKNMYGDYMIPKEEWKYKS